MYSTTAKMELSDIVVANLHHDVPHPQLVIEKRTGKIFALTIKFTYGSGVVSDFHISELGSKEKLHLRPIDLKHYYFINEIKKIGGYNTAMEPMFKTMSFGDVIIEWYDYNKEIPLNDTWMVKPERLLTPIVDYYKVFGKTTPNNQILAFFGIPNFGAGISKFGDAEIDVGEIDIWCVLRSLTVNGVLMFTNKVIL